MKHTYAEISARIGLIAKNHCPEFNLKQKKESPVVWTLLEHRSGHLDQRVDDEEVAQVTNPGGQRTVRLQQGAGIELSVFLERLLDEEDQVEERHQGGQALEGVAAVVTDALQ